MSNPVQRKGQAHAKPSFTAVDAGFLQRKCACGGTAGLAEDCENCGRKQMSVQRVAANAAAPRGVKESRCSPVDVTPAAGGVVNDPKVFEWHSIMWLTKASGSWAIDAAKSEIKSGAIALGTSGP